MPRAGLSTDAVVALALEAVDAGGPRGFETLTLTTVAARAGVAVPSLYKHVGGLPALRRAVAVVCVDEFRTTIEEALAATGGHPAGPVPGAEDLRAVAAAVRAWGRRRPGRYLAAVGSSWATDPGATEVHVAGERAVAVLADVVGRLGVPPERTVDAIRAVRAALHGFVMLELDGGFGMPDDVDASFGFLLDLLADALTVRTP